MGKDQGGGGRKDSVCKASYRGDGGEVIVLSGKRDSMVLGGGDGRQVCYKGSDTAGSW